MKKVKYKKKCSKCGKFFDVTNVSRGLCDNCRDWWKKSQADYEKEKENADI